MVVPRITTNVKSNIILTAGEEFGTGAMVGEATWGDLSTVKTFSNYQEVVDTFKSGALVDGAKYYFNNGGKTLIVARVTPSSVAASESTYTFQNGGTTDVITITAKYKGTYGDSIGVTITGTTERTVTITDGTDTETYADLTTNTEIVDAINAASTLVTATLDASTPLVDTYSQTFLASGADGTTVTQDYIDELSEGGSMWLEEYDYLSIPGQTDNAFHSSIQTIMNSRKDDENLFSIYITGVDKFEDKATTLARTATNSNGRLVVCATSLYKGDGALTDTNNWLDGSYTGCAFNGFLCSLEINTSPTNKVVPFTASKTLSEQFYTSTERGEYADAGFVIFDRLYNNQYGCVIAVTRNGDETAWEYMLDSRRKVDFLLSETVDVEKQFLGEPNDDFTRRGIKSGVSSVMVGARSDRIINSYQVDVLQGTDPRAVDVNITVSLVNEVDFININLTLTI